MGEYTELVIAISVIMSMTVLSSVMVVALSVIFIKVKLNILADAGKAIGQVALEAIKEYRGIDIDE